MQSSSLEEHFFIASSRERHNSEATMDDYMSGIEIQKLEEARQQALSTWVLRVKAVSFIQMALAIALFAGSFIWTTFGNVALVIFGLYGSYNKQLEASFVYIVLNALNIPKSIGLMAYYPLDSVWYAILSIDMIISLPALYVGFYLYQSLRANMVALNELARAGDRSRSQQP